MKINIKLVNKDRRISSFGYRELATKMWFKEKDGKELELSHVGNDDTLQEDFYLSVSIDKWLNDTRWSMVRNLIKLEDIGIEWRDKNRDITTITTKHIDILTVDKRALFIMVIEIASEVQGIISEDELKTWITIEEFKTKHQDILAMSYEEANEVSLKEAETMEAIEEPWEWYEDDDE